MRRGFVVVAVVAVVLGVAGLAVSPASATPVKKLDREVSGSFSGTSRWNFGEGCAFVHQVFDGTLTPAADTAPASYHFDTCVTPANVVFTVQGTFTVVTGRGATG